MNSPSPVPLYLTTREPLRVELEEATLVLQADGRAERWLPLQRVSRIIANDQAQLTTAALLACAEHGITLLFVDDGGLPVARVMGRPGERQELRQRLTDLLMLADGEDHYRDWLRSQRRRAMLEVGARLRLGAPPRSTRAFSQALERGARRWADATTAADLRRQLHGLALSWTAQHLGQLGLGATSEMLQDGHPDLVADLGGLLAWRAEPLCFGLLRRRHERSRRSGGPVRPVTRREAIRLWQRNGARMGRAGRDLSNRLHRWLVELA